METGYEQIIMKKFLDKYKSMPVAAKATLWFIITSTLQKGMSLITTPVFTRLMTTIQYGQYSVYNSWLQIFSIITTLQLSMAVFNKGMSMYKDDRNTYTSTMQTITTLMTALVFVVYAVFHNQINELTELPTYIMIALFVELLFSPAISFWTLHKRYEYHYKAVVFRTILFTVLNAGIGVLVVSLADEKGYARILSCICVNIAFGLPLYLYNYHVSEHKFKKEYAVFAIKFNAPLLLHYFSMYVLDQFDRIMIQKMVNSGSAGIYSVAYNAGQLMRIITQSINSSLIPWQYGNLEKKNTKKIDDTLFLIFILVGSCSVIFSAFAPELMKILADKKYYEAVYVVPPIAISMFFTFAYTIFANVEFFYNRNKFTMFISMSGAVVNVILNYVCIRLFGFVAAAYTTLFCYVLFSVAHFIYMNLIIKKEIGAEYCFNGKRFISLVAVILLAGLSVVFLYDKIIIRYLFILVALCIAFVKRQTIITLLKGIRKKGEKNHE